MIFIILGVGNQKPFVLGYFVLVVVIFVGDHVAVRMAAVAVDRPAYKTLLSMGFDIFLNGIDLVVELLQRQVVQISGVDQFDIVSVVILFLFDK